MAVSARLLQTHEAAEFLGTTRQVLANWRLQNRGPKYLRFGKRSIRYRQSDLDTWIEQSLIDPSKEA